MTVEVVSAPNLYRQSHTRSMTTHRQNPSKNSSFAYCLIHCTNRCHSTARAILDATLN
jgi:hypothetical protein